MGKHLHGTRPDWPHCCLAEAGPDVRVGHTLEVSAKSMQLYWRMGSVPFCKLKLPYSACKFVYIWNFQCCFFPTFSKGSAMFPAFRKRSSRDSANWALSFSTSDHGNGPSKNVPWIGSDASSKSGDSNCIKLYHKLQTGSNKVRVFSDATG